MLNKGWGYSEGVIANVPSVAEDTHSEEDQPAAYEHLGTQKRHACQTYVMNADFSPLLSS